MFVLKPHSGWSGVGIKSQEAPVGDGARQLWTLTGDLFVRPSIHTLLLDLVTLSSRLSSMSVKWFYVQWRVFTWQKVT